MVKPVSSAAPGVAIGPRERPMPPAPPPPAVSGGAASDPGGASVGEMRDGTVLPAFEQALGDLLPDAFPAQTRLVIEVDSDTRRFVYKSVDAVTGDVVRQWPSEDILGMIKAMRNLTGLIADNKV